MLQELNSVFRITLFQQYFNVIRTKKKENCGPQKYTKAWKPRNISFHVMMLKNMLIVIKIKSIK